MTAPRSLGLIEAAALLRVLVNTQQGGWEDERMVQNYAHHSPGYLAQFANNVRKKTCG